MYYKVTRNNLIKIAGQYREMISNVSNQSNKLIEIVNNLLLFSKDLPISKKSNVNLNLIIEDVVNVVQSEYNSNKVSCKIVGDEIDVLGDEMLLERVFYNLIENAVKYSKNNKNVVITLDSMNKTVRISDEGCGIPDLEKEKIFDVFYRCEASKEHTNGNGIGLSIVKSIIEKHDGKIAVYDNKPIGTIFEITF